MPSTLPASRRRGDSVVSSSSTTREDFSSVTLWATIWPNIISTTSRAISPIAISPRSRERLREAGSSTSTGQRGRREGAQRLCLGSGRSLRSRSNTLWAETASCTTRTAGSVAERLHQHPPAVEQCDGDRAAAHRPSGGRAARAAGACARRGRRPLLQADRPFQRDGAGADETDVVGGACRRGSARAAATAPPPVSDHQQHRARPAAPASVSARPAPGVPPPTRPAGRSRRHQLPEELGEGRLQLGEVRDRACAAGRIEDALRIGLRCEPQDRSARRCAPRPRRR